jgi:acetyl-CoA carboxylase biotin carboxyl carrier protein
MVLSENSHMITSPVMGIFYRSSAPEEKPYVEVGKKVNASDVVCLIESMKVFTKLRADKDGTVKEIFVENEETVMKNQDLIEIEIG